MIQLADGNSTATIDPYSQSGMNSWVVDGTNQLNKQWFWYGIDSGGDLPINSLGTGGGTTLVSSSGSSATLTYARANDLSIKVIYTLSGGVPGSGLSDLGELIDIVNISGTTKTLHFFQYSDFNLNNVPSGDSLSFPDSHTVDQFKGDISLAETMAETVDTPAASRHEGNYVTASDAILTRLNSGSATSLSNLPAIGGASLGPGDMAWAYEWDRTLLPGGELKISKDKNLTGVLGTVPEPGTLALLGVGAIGLLAYGRRRGKR